MLKDPKEIRRQIERTRERIGGTLDAIRYKTDVPQRVQETFRDVVHYTKATLLSRVRPSPPTPRDDI